MKFTKIILGTLLATVALQTAQLNAVLISSAIMGPLEKVICFLGEDHGTKNEATAQQLQDLLKLMSSFNPKDICVITEAPDIRLSQNGAKRVDGDVSIVNQIAQFCESKQIEVHKIDFRKVLKSGTLYSIRSHINAVSIKEIVDALESQFNIIDQIDTQLISKDFRNFFQTLKEASLAPEFADKSGEYFFAQRTDISGNTTAQLTAELIDARIKAEIQKTRAKIVFVVVGHMHAYHTAQELQQTGRYKVLFAQKAPDSLITGEISTEMLKGLNIDMKEFEKNLVSLLAQKEEGVSQSSSSNDLDEKKNVSTQTQEDSRISKKQKTQPEETR